ncbi:MAG: TfoX/Sxy family protein [Pirellulales bacterium]
MPYSKQLADRVRRLLGKRPGLVEKRMFGGVVFMFRGNMLVGIWQLSLIARLGPEAAARALTEPNVGEFDAAGRPMRGWVLVEPDGLEARRPTRNLADSGGSVRRNIAGQVDFAAQALPLACLPGLVCNGPIVRRFVVV